MNANVNPTVYLTEDELQAIDQAFSDAVTWQHQVIRKGDRATEADRAHARNAWAQYLERVAKLNACLKEGGFIID